MESVQGGSETSDVVRMETVALTKRQEAEMALGVTRMDQIRNEYIRGTPQVGRFGENMRQD